MKESPAVVLVSQADPIASDVRPPKQRYMESHPYFPFPEVSIDFDLVEALFTVPEDANPPSDD